MIVCQGPLGSKSRISVPPVEIAAHRAALARIVAVHGRIAAARAVQPRARLVLDLHLERTELRDAWAQAMKKAREEKGRQGTEGSGVYAG